MKGAYHPKLAPGRPGIDADIRWNEQLSTLPGRSFFHTAQWAQVLSGTYGYAPILFQAVEPCGRPAWLPLMEVDSWLTGRRGISLPFADDCPPLCQEAGTFQALFRQAVAFGKKRGWQSIECRGGRELLCEAPASLLFCGHRVDLTAGREALFERLDGSVRQAIRKAEKSGVTVEISQTREAVRIFYALHCRTRRKHGQPPQPFRFFLNLHRHVILQDLGLVVLARHRGRPVSASVYLHFGDQALYKFGASDEAFQGLRGGNLVMWKALTEYVRRGARCLDMGRTSPANAGLRHFKRGWGAAEHAVEYVKFDLVKNRFLTETDAANGWHTPVFRRLPLWMARTAGALFYKHWA